MNKIMDYEKKYKEALERARQFSEKPYLEDSKGIVDYIFPELKESEDERIIDRIIHALHGDVLEMSEIKEAITWLEKQSTPQVRTGLEWVNTIDNACDKRYSEEYAHGEYCHEQSFKWGFQEGVDWLEKQGEPYPILSNSLNIGKVEQKPAWSEEDINMFGSILSTLGVCANNPQIPADIRSIHKKEESWFNKLYHRVLPEQEWSEEQIKVLDKVIRNPHLSTDEYNGLIALKEQLKTQKGESV